MSKRTLTTAELESRQSNAEKSTGPRTLEGKQRTRMNALRHGAYAQHFRHTLVALEEDPAGYDALLERLLGAFQLPSARREATSEPTPLVAFAIEELAELHWELERERRLLNRLRQWQADEVLDRTEQRRASLDTDAYTETAGGGRILDREIFPRRLQADLRRPHPADRAT